MSLERVLKALTKLGLSQRESEVYVYLATEGPQETGNIAENLKLGRKQVSSSLESLRKREFVIISLEYSTQFSAISFRKVMALLMKAKRAEAQHLEQNREEILSEWNSMVRGNSAT